MTIKALQMPTEVAALINLPLLGLGLEVDDETEDMVGCSLLYEDGTEISLLILYVSERKWFRERKALVISFVTLGSDSRVTKVFHRETIAVPNGPHDVRFMFYLSSRVRAVAWTLAVIGGMGECVDLPRRQQFE